MGAFGAASGGLRGGPGTVQTDYLKYFIDVAKLGSLTAAAEKNFMTPQGMSRSISALESQLGCKLFDRSRNKISLTYIGSELLGSVESMISDERQLRTRLYDLQKSVEESSAKTVIGYVSPIAFDTPLLYPVDIRSDAVNNRIHFFQRPTGQVVESLVKAAREPQADAVTIGALGLYECFPEENAEMVERLKEAGYEYRPIVQMCDFVLVSSRSPLARKKSLTRADICSQPLAVSSQGDMERTIEHLYGTDQIFVSTANSEFRTHLCQSDEAISFIPGISLVYGTPEGTVAIPMATPYLIEIGFVAEPEVFEMPFSVEGYRKIRDFYGPRQGSGAVKLVAEKADSIVRLG